MDKNGAYEFLNYLRDYAEIADVTCDVVANGEFLYTNQSILVFLTEQPSNDDLIKPSEHWWICESIDELFEDMFISKVKCIKGIKMFTTDFK